jgi:hypothetical protein
MHPVTLRLLAWFLLACSVPTAAQELTLRAGELLSCFLEEPNLSSKTSPIGEPVVCYLAQFREFGHAAFPRGSYLAGRLADFKDPGRLAGKGWLGLQFDRLILPNTEIPVSTRVVSARGFKVDGSGHIEGRGHATRDAVAWSIPILWPVQLVRLPARGPRPTLRGEQPLSVRLLDDVTLPCYQAGRASPCR